ncbi:MAG: 4Fe-4S dicluster domain-containing protein [Euryarchaeota archaeon]|nr:4Fe-4S dicluster domain-containing protein [Euryarchaeota archaeon]
MAVEEFKDEVTIRIDCEKCDGCGDCVEICPTEVYEMVDGRVAAPNIAECIECCACVEVCPEGAIGHDAC